MKIKIGYLAAAVGLLSLSGVMITSCAVRLWPGGDSGRGSALSGREIGLTPDARPLAKASTGEAKGEIKVDIPWPAFSGRSTQFTYGGGSAVSALEVFLTDSLNNYQSAVVLRNTAANGTAAGTASVVFTGVPAGNAVVTVHTTTKNLLGDLVIASAVASTSYTSVTNKSPLATVSVVPMTGDQAAQFLVFKSSDLLGAAAANGAPTVYLTTKRVHDTGTRTNQNEITDGGGSGRAGYGIGAGTVTVPVPSLGAVSVTVNVTAAPAFDASLYPRLTDPINSSTFSVSDVANSMSLQANGVVPGDEIIATDSALHAAVETEVVDLAKDLGYRLPVTSIVGNTISFNTTRAFLPNSSGNLPALNLYLRRGSMISLLYSTQRKMPTLAILPGVFDATGSTGGSTMTTVLKKDAIDTVSLNIRDRFGNPISDLGPLAQANSQVVIKRDIAPVLAAATRILVPSKTYGSINAFACSDPVNKPGRWTASYTQGGDAATDDGATVSIAFDVIKSGQITALLEYLLPFRIASNNRIEIEATTPSVGNLKIDVYSTVGGATGSAQLVATKTAATSTLTTASASLLVQAGYILVSGAAVDTTVNGTRITNITTKTLGNRKVGDTDLLTVSIDASASSGAFSKTVTYSWAK